MAECKRCDGCGLTSNKFQHVPWSHLVGHDSDQDSVEIDGLTHYPMVCSNCGGLGKERVSSKPGTP